MQVEPILAEFGVTMPLEDGAVQLREVAGSTQRRCTDPGQLSIVDVAARRLRRKPLALPAWRHDAQRVVEENNTVPSVSIKVSIDARLMQQSTPRLCQDFSHGAVDVCASVLTTDPAG